MAVAANMQIKSEDLISLNQRLIPPSLAYSFGLPYDKDELNSKVTKEQPAHSHQRDNHYAQKSSPSRKRHHGDDVIGAPSSSTPAGASPAGTAQAAKATNSQRADASRQSPGAAQHTSSAGALLQQATSSQQQQPLGPQQQQQQASSISAGYAQRPAVPPQAAAAAAAAAVALNPFAAAAYNPAAAAATYNPAAAAATYRFQPQTLLPYMGAAPQAMAMPALSGSLGCASMSMYGAAGDYSQLMRAQEEDADDTQARALKRPRLVWTPQLHKLFEEAVQKIGLDKAVPKTIMQYMNVEGLTRENVASHLQKYRLSLKKTTTDADGKPTDADASTGGGGDIDDAGGAAASAAAAAAGTGSGSGSGSPDVRHVEAEAATTSDSSKRGADGAAPDRLQSAASGPTGASAQKELATAAVAEGGAAAQETLSAGLEALEVVGNGEQQQQQQQQEDQQ